MSKIKLEIFKGKSHYHEIGDKSLDKILVGTLAIHKSNNEVISGGEMSYHLLKDIGDVIHWTNQVIPNTIELTNTFKDIL